VVSDIPVDNEASIVTSEISRSVGAQSFGGAHKGRVCVYVFIGVGVCACCERLSHPEIFQFQDVNSKNN
jgi:hypothetical protein